MAHPGQGSTEGNSKRAPRVAFAIVLAVFAVGTPLSWWQGREPYPALVMPAFPLYRGTVVRTEADGTVHFEDGQSAPVSFYNLLPPSPLEPTSVVARTFNNDEWPADAEIVAWLRTRLEREFPGRTVTAIDVVWRLKTYGGGSSNPDPIRSLHIDFA